MKICAKEEWFQEHLKRIQEIAEIDIAAAMYIRDEAPATLKVFNYGLPLSSMFPWADTPHGYNYWCKINRALGDLTYNFIGD
jgi:hypothetical protein